MTCGTTIQLGTSNPTSAASFAGRPFFVNTTDNSLWILSGTTPIKIGAGTSSVNTSYPSACGTAITQGSGTIYDASNNAVTLATDGKVYSNGTALGYSSGVVEVKWINNGLYQKNSSGQVYFYDGNASYGWTLVSTGYPTCGSTTTPVTSLAAQVVADMKAAGDAIPMGYSAPSYQTQSPWTRYAILQLGAQTNPSIGAPSYSTERLCSNPAQPWTAYWSTLR